MTAQRSCFVIRLRSGATDAYIARHSPVWPEMLEALRDSGWRNYSIFLHPDGFVVGYFEADDVDQALLRMAETEVNRRWQDASAHLFGSEIVWLSEVFNLEQQLLD